MMKKEEKILNNVVKVLAIFVTVVTIFVALTCTINFGKVIKGCMYETEVTDHVTETVERVVTFNSQEEKEFAMVTSFLFFSGSIGLAVFTVSYTIDKIRGKEFFS